MRKLAASFLPPMLCLSLASAATITRLDGSKITDGQLDAKITQLMRDAKVAGLAVAVLNDGKVVYSRAHGLKNVATRAPLTPRTVMYGASFTKSAFAVAVMQLVDEKKLDLDKPIGAYLAKPLPEYEKFADLAGDSRWQKITPRMLLSHTAGFPNLRFLTDDKKLRIYFEPGSRYAYSGEGIALLQLVVDQITKESLTDVMRKRVFDPAGMTRTSMVWQADWDQDFALGYNEDGSVAGVRKRSSPGAIGSMGTTLDDWSGFLAALLDGKALDSAAMREMLKPQIRIRSATQFPTLSEATTAENDAIQLSYGLGWGVFQTPAGPAFFKEGHDDGWENHCVCFPRSKTCLVLMANSSNGDKIFKELLEFAIGDKWTPWRWEGYIPFTP